MSRPAGLTSDRRLSAARLLHGLAAVCVAAAVLGLVWPVTAPPTPEMAVPTVPSLRLPAEDGLSQQQATQLVARHPFSARRAAPAVRFSPPGIDAGLPAAAATDPVAGTIGSGEAPPMDATDGDGGPFPRLLGLVTVDGIRQAVLRLRATEVPVRLADGASHRGVRVLAIRGDAVTLRVDGRPLTLRLDRQARDSL